MIEFLSKLTVRAVLSVTVTASTLYFIYKGIITVEQWLAINAVSLAFWYKAEKE